MPAGMTLPALALRLERWSTGNAVLLSCALLSALWLGKPWPLGVAAFGSFAALLLLARSAWTRAADFGAANAVTLLRLVLVIVLSLALHGASGLLLGALVLGTFALDGVDGWLARRAGSASEFGAHFDMEVDALLVLTASTELYLSGKFGLWILCGGVLRYLYVLSVALFPPPGGAMPRTLLGRSAFALVVVGLALGLICTGSVGLPAAALGTTAVALSFARSALYGYARSAKPLADT